jgi:hypothetical protein
MPDLLVGRVYEKEVCIVHSTRLDPTATILFGLLSVAACLLSSCGQFERSHPVPTAWDTALPHSAKGYELYSWPADEGQGWQYALITGTNRLKTYEELVSAEDGISESGWLRISASGAEQLKALLSRLPDGESVIWLGSDWLEQMGVPAGRIQLPGGDLIDEIARHCRQAGVELSVVQ